MAHRNLCESLWEGFESWNIEFKRILKKAMVQVVDPNDLVEAVQRTRYGVNGNVGGLLPDGWRKKLNGFLVNSLSSNARSRATATPV